MTEVTRLKGLCQRVARNGILTERDRIARRSCWDSEVIAEAGEERLALPVAHSKFGYVWLVHICSLKGALSHDYHMRILVDAHDHLAKVQVRAP